MNWWEWEQRVRCIDQGEGVKTPPCPLKLESWHYKMSWLFNQRCSWEMWGGGPSNSLLNLYPGTEKLVDIHQTVWLAETKWGGGGVRQQYFLHFCEVSHSSIESYPWILHQIGNHDDGCRLLFPNHGPEIIQGTRQWTLCRDVLLVRIQTLPIEVIQYILLIIVLIPEWQNGQFTWVNAFAYGVNRGLRLAVIVYKCPRLKNVYKSNGRCL